MLKCSTLRVGVKTLHNTVLSLKKRSSTQKPRRPHNAFSLMPMYIAWYGHVADVSHWQNSANMYLAIFAHKNAALLFCRVFKNPIANSSMID